MIPQRLFLHLRTRQENRKGNTEEYEEREGEVATNFLRLRASWESLLLLIADPSVIIGKPRCQVRLTYETGSVIVFLRID